MIDLENDATDAIVDVLNGPHGRKEAAGLVADRERWGVDPKLRRKVLDVAKAFLEHPGIKPRSFATVAKIILEAAKQDQADTHHIEGARMQVEHTDGRPHELQAAELLLKLAAVTGRADLKAQAAALAASQAPALPAPSSPPAGPASPSVASDASPAQTDRNPD